MVARPIVLGLAATWLACSSDTTKLAPTTATVGGVVTDLSGAPIGAVHVSLPGVGAVTTGPDGSFALTDVPAADRAVLTFTAPGFAAAARPVHVIAGATVAVRATLVERPPPIRFRAEAGVGVVVDGARVAIPPDAVVDAAGQPVIGDIALSVTPLDVTGDALAAFPGDVVAETAGGAPALLETYAVAEVVLEQGGAELALAPGATATLSLALPDDTPLAAGDTVPAWYFDPARGRWIEDGAGLVGPAPDGGLAWTVSVPHLTWWNCDTGWSTIQCLHGKVLDDGGDPLPGAEVDVWGYEYNGGTVEHTDGDGEFCVPVRVGSLVLVRVWREGYPEHLFVLRSETTPAQCWSEDCTQLDDVVLMRPHGFNGRVVDGQGQPLADVPVWNRAANDATVAGPDGTFCVEGPNGAASTIQTRRNDFPQIRTSVPAPLTGVVAPCAEGGGSSVGDVVLRDPTCYGGQVRDATGAPLVGVPVTATTAETRTVIATDSDGRFCANLLPDTETRFSVRHPTRAYMLLEQRVTTVTREGFCGGTDCEPLPAFDFPAPSCVVAHVRASSGAPVADRRQVWSGAGAFALTDPATGDACVAASAGGDAALTCVGCDLATAVAPAAAGCDAPAGCAQVSLQLGAAAPKDVLVPAGPFMMGCEPNNPSLCLTNEQPRHEVTLSAFRLDTFEVTNAEYALWLNADNPDATCEGQPCVYSMHDTDEHGLYREGDLWLVDGGYEQRPVVRVTWYGAKGYCEALGARLPTEAEWEKAAKGADAHYLYPWGDSWDPTAANTGESDDPYSLDTPPTTPVGFYDGGAHGGYATRDGRSPYGAHDLCGNAYEWVSDWYQNGYGEPPEGGWIDPTGPETGLQRNMRGGSWRGKATTTFRAGWPPDYQHDYIGFRCARAAE